ncbi:hypothetical protein K457DRAFT_1371611 [Linnemannia elongata AG-77]|uniref:Golgi apparatus membrane protein tvp38 n=1 Tax=Linnemannia elongata AG-77 TaxID=1314771 RepID=A0A197JA26_9FUNG|nr:hypothetical protein K457DRAFT_1371611 [Linnemannia elongata AG-77]
MDVKNRVYTNKTSFSLWSYTICNLGKRGFGNEQLQRHRNNLMSYIILLRLAPFPPNWFVNICSPHLNVPLWPEFFLGTLIGVSAPSVVHVQAGMVLEKLVEDHSSGVDVLTLKNFLMLGAVALLAALPVLIRWVLARHELSRPIINNIRHHHLNRLFVGGECNVVALSR